MIDTWNAYTFEKGDMQCYWVIKLCKKNQSNYMQCI